MKKISTLYLKNPKNLALVTNQVDPQCNWVFTDIGVVATKKYDGTAMAVIDGLLYKRYCMSRPRSNKRTLATLGVM